MKKKTKQAPKDVPGAILLPKGHIVYPDAWSWNLYPGTWYKITYHGTLAAAMSAAVESLVKAKACEQNVHSVEELIRLVRETRAEVSACFGTGIPEKTPAPHGASHGVPSRRGREG